MYAKCILFVCLCAFQFNISAANNSKGDYKVGLVLSGGGAKGIAHVGVIKALEENGISFDCVSGTSMGAIVGSLYACGYSPEEMLELFTSENFKYWSSGYVDPSKIYYETQPAPNPQWLDVDLSFTHKKSDNIMDQVIPSNLISPIPMNLEFLKLYAPYTIQCRENFDNLFVPLRTVCSDVYHKHKIVCKSGSLGDAVRASMSFPLVFKPIEMDGVLVYDGGIYDNFPVDVMHDDFDPDFIIGVSVSGPDGKPIPGDIYSQLEDMIIQNNDYELPEKLGVKIQVPVLDFGVLDWSEAETIYNIGYKTGLSMVDSIKARCDYRVSPEEIAERRNKFKKETPALEFNGIEVDGGTPKQQDYIKSLFQSRQEKEIGISKVEDGYYRAVSDGKFEDLLPQAKFNEDAEPILLLKASIKNPWTVGAGGWITTSTHSQIYVNFGYHTLSFNSLDLEVSGWLGQSYYAGMLSGRMTLRSQNPSSLKLLAVASGQKLYENELLFYQTTIPSFVNETQQFGRIEYDMAFGKPGRGFVSLSAGRTKDEFFPSFENKYNIKDKTIYTSGALKIGYEYNTLDNPLYPMGGRWVDANIIAVYEKAKNKKYGDETNQLLSTEIDHNVNVSAEFEWKNFYMLHKNFRLGAMAKGLMTISKLYEGYIPTLIHSPAFAPTPSTKNYFNVAFRSGNYIAAGVIPIWNPVQKFQIRGDFYVYSPVRNLVQDGERCKYDGWFRKVEFIGEAAAVYNFKFASLSLYCNYLTYPAKNWNFGLNLGLYFQAPKFTR